MSSFAEIAEVYYSTIGQHDDYDARLRLIVEPGVARLEKKRRAAYDARSRSRAYRCKRCGAFGHNKRACMAETALNGKRVRGVATEHLDFLIAHFRDLRYVAWAGSWRPKGPDYTVELQPFNERLDVLGVRTFAIRLMSDEGRHLVGLIEAGSSGARVVYATRATRPQCDAAVVKLLETFG